MPDYQLWLDGKEVEYSDEGLREFTQVQVINQAK
jgi:hypothetical protein